MLNLILVPLNLIITFCVILPIRIVVSFVLTLMCLVHVAKTIKRENQN